MNIILKSEKLRSFTKRQKLLGNIEIAEEEKQD